eukprot:11261132-Ditylum_brightwellii.AAC.1
MDVEAEIEVRTVGRATICEDELSAFEVDDGMESRYGVVIYHHIQTRGLAKKEGPGAITTISKKEGSIGRFQGGLEELDKTSFLEIKVGAEGAITYGASGVYRGKETDLPPILHVIVHLNDNYTNKHNPEEVSYLQCIRCQLVLAVT